MAALSVENLHCPICCEIFQDPVILFCSHSFCRGCLQRWWTERNLLCPVCKTRSSQRDPPRNLALRNLCEAFLEQNRRPSADLVARCSLHSEELRLFCLDHQQPVCVVCLHSQTHKNHSFSPIDEAGRDYKEILQELLKPLQERLDLIFDIKGNFDQTAKDIEVQAQDTERQIKDEISMLQRFLQQEEKDRLAALRLEKQQKTQMIKSKSEALDKEVADLSVTVGATEEVLRADNVSFLQSYKTTADTVQRFHINYPPGMPHVLIDFDKHLKNLPFNILDGMKKKVTNTRKPQIPSQDPLPSLQDRLSSLRAGDRRSFCASELYNTSQNRAESNTLFETRARTRKSLALSSEIHDAEFRGLLPIPVCKRQWPPPPTPPSS